MTPTNTSQYDSRKRFLAFITIGFLIAAATGVVVWKTSGPSSDSLSDAGPMVVSKTPHAVNVTDKVTTTTTKLTTSTSVDGEADQGIQRPSSRVTLNRQQAQDPLLPPNAFVGPSTAQLTESQYSQRTNNVVPAAPETGIQETQAADGVVSESVAAQPVPPSSRRVSAAPQRTTTTRKRFDFTTPEFTTRAPVSTTASPAEPVPAPSDEPTPEETPSAPETLEPQDGAIIPETSAETSTSPSEASPTDVIVEPTAPLLPEESAPADTPLETTRAQSSPSVESTAEPAN